MPNVGPMEIAIVLIIALVVFGPKKLPDLGKSLGKGMREFKGSLGGNDDAPKATASRPAEVESRPKV
jgi:sec-independent protein translocase protein TatA